MWTQHFALQGPAPPLVPINLRVRLEVKCAAIVAMMSPDGLNIGIDNATVDEKGNAIIVHQRSQLQLDAEGHDGVRLIGGGRSRLHRSSPFKQRWALMRDGDLWQVFADVVRQRGPHSVIITKVKGHATDQMVQDGAVKQKGKDGWWENRKHSISWSILNLC